MATNAPHPQLQHLHDIVLPTPVSWYPQTMAWWFLLVFFVLVLAWAGHAIYTRWQANRYRRLALNQLRRLEADLTIPDRRLFALTEVPVLLKKTVLACWSRSEVASLSGDAWLRFLDESYGGKGFTQGPGRLLPTLAYSPLSNLEQLVETHPSDMNGLIQLIREWIQQHHV